MNESELQKRLNDAKIREDKKDRDIHELRAAAVRANDAFEALRASHMELQLELQKAHELEYELRTDPVHVRHSFVATGFGEHEIRLDLGPGNFSVAIDGVIYDSLAAIGRHLKNQKESIHEQNLRRKEDRKAIKRMARQLAAVRSAVEA